jgi:hypothetical protein
VTTTRRILPSSFHRFLATWATIGLAPRIQAFAAAGA